MFFSALLVALFGFGTKEILHDWWHNPLVTSVHNAVFEMQRFPLLQSRLVFSNTTTLYVFLCIKFDPSMYGAREYHANETDRNAPKWSMHSFHDQIFFYYRLDEPYIDWLSSMVDHDNNETLPLGTMEALHMYFGELDGNKNSGLQEKVFSHDIWQRATTAIEKQLERIEKER